MVSSSSTQSLFLCRFSFFSPYLFSPSFPFLFSFPFFHFNFPFLFFTSLLSSSFSFFSTSLFLSFPFILSSSHHLPIYSCFPLISYHFSLLFFFLFLNIFYTCKYYLLPQSYATHTWVWLKALLYSNFLARSLMYPVPMHI